MIAFQIAWNLGSHNPFAFPREAHVAVGKYFPDANMRRKTSAGPTNLSGIVKAR